MQRTIEMQSPILTLLVLLSIGVFVLLYWFAVTALQSRQEMLARDEKLILDAYELTLICLSPEVDAALLIVNGQKSAFTAASVTLADSDRALLASEEYALASAYHADAVCKAEQAMNSIRTDLETERQWVQICGRRCHNLWTKLSDEQSRLKTQISAKRAKALTQSAFALWVKLPLIADLNHDQYKIDLALDVAGRAAYREKARRLDDSQPGDYYA
jgi:hypothetical protein